MINTIIVDDEVLARLGMRTFLEGHDDIRVNADFGLAKDALEYLKEHRKTDIVITDIEMAEMNGLEFIKQLKQNNLAKGIIIISCHNDFEYAREAISLGADSYILKQEINDELLKAEILKVYNEKCNKFEQRISRSIHDIPDNYIKEDNTYAVGVLRFSNNYDKYGNVLSAPFDEGMVEHLLDSIIQKHQIGTLFVPRKKDMFIVFCFSKKYSKENSLKKIEDTFYDLQQNVKIYINRELYIGVSGLFTDINLIPEFYIAASKAADMHFYDGMPSMPLHEVQKTANGEYTALSFTADGFLDEQGIVRFGEELKRYLFMCKGKKVEVDDLKQQLIKKLNIFVWSVLHEYSFSEALVKKWDNKLQYFEMIRVADNARVLEQNLTNLMEQCQTELLTQLKNEEFNAVFQFVNEHIESKISLAEMAELNCMSTASFCKKFKERTGMTLIQYINLKKVEQVKNLLKETQYSLGQIAEMAGFCNENYMIRVFKKVTGQTIKNYKKGKS